MKKSVTLIVMALLAVVGAKADIIPSTYYSEPAAGTYYIYNVTEGKFLRTAGLNENTYSLLDAPVAVTLTAKGETVCKGGGDYILSGNNNQFVKIGQYGGQWLWSNADSGNADILAWTFNSKGTKTYTLSVTLDANFSEKGSTLNAGTYYMKDVSNLGSEAEAGTYALIAEANYYNYLASTTATIPATYYTTTPAAGTYYLYNIERNGFIYRGGDGNYAGLETTPATLTLTSNGAGAFYIKFEDGKYLKTGTYNKCYVWTDATDESFAWTFESFHGATSLFQVKCYSSDESKDIYIYSGGISARGVNAWSAPDANRTQYAWALITPENYTAWQNSFVLNEATGFSTVGDVYNVSPTVNRTMTANVWNTLVVPFDMAIPSGWTVKEPTAFADGTLTFGDASTIVHGKPYIVKPTEAVTSFSATGVTLYKDLQNTTVGDLTMTGTYTAMDAVPEGSYVVGIKDGASALYKVNSTVSLAPFRAYFTVADGGSVKSSIITMNFDGTETAIEEIGEMDNEQLTIYNAAGAVYDLSGRRVNVPQRGLYIVNGKKVVISRN